MHERLRINHGVGSRTLLDSDLNNVTYEYEQRADGWHFVVQTPRTPAVEDVLRLKDEINVFIFKEENGRQVEKIWFYTGDGSARYDDAAKCLYIQASSHIAYPAQGFLQ